MNAALPDRPALGQLAGVDEAGRGPLAGDVVAAAVVLDTRRPIGGLNDSKKLTERQREQLYSRIVGESLGWSVGRASPGEIDAMNILQATFLAMRRAVEGLVVVPAVVWVDGNRLPAWEYTAQAIVKGDARVPEIAAASILAKVTRDRDMRDLDRRYPGYGFARHKGYPTSAHREQLALLGACPAHRRSFRPVAEAVASAPIHTQADGIMQSQE